MRVGVIGSALASLAALEMSRARCGREVLVVDTPHMPAMTIMDEWGPVDWPSLRVPPLPKRSMTTRPVGPTRANTHDLKAAQRKARRITRRNRK